jgi:hypothetical protein
MKKYGEYNATLGLMRGVGNDYVKWDFSALYQTVLNDHFGASPIVPGYLEGGLDSLGAFRMDPLHQQDPLTE